MPNCFDQVGKRPAAYDRIEAEDQHAGHDAEQCEQRPPFRCSGRSGDRGHAVDRVRSSVAADCQFAEHQGEDDQDQAGDVADNEAATAVGADFIGEFPNAPEPDGRGDIGQDEAGSAGPLLPLRGHARALGLSVYVWRLCPMVAKPAGLPLR